jgi:hypothetical protein
MEYKAKSGEIITAEYPKILPTIIVRLPVAVRYRSIPANMRKPSTRI